MTFKTFLLAAAIVLPTVAQAQTFDELGSGATSCGKWNVNRQSQNDDLAYMDRSWVLGFLSGMGFVGATTGINPLHGLDSAAVTSWIDNYCWSNPLIGVDDAAIAFFKVHPR
jgi:hypothetical protein